MLVVYKRQHKTDTGHSQEFALTERAPADTPCLHALVAHKSSPSQRGHQRCPLFIKELVMWIARQSLYRPWDVCLSCAWPSRLRSGQPMLSLCCRIPGRRHLFLCASRLALCQPMSDVTFPIARPSAVRRSRCQGCSHAVGRS